MPRRSIRRPELEPHQRALAAMIDDALTRGQRGDGTSEKHWLPWKHAIFADKAGVSESSVANWRDPDAMMPPEDIQPLLRTLYGAIDRFKVDKEKMQRLWRLARGYIVDDDVAAEDWRISRSLNLQGVARLVSLQAHRPVPWNDGTLRLSITLIIKPDRELSYRGKAITIGLTDALLCLQAGAYQPAYKSRPSQRGVPNFELAVDGDRVVGPLDPLTGMIDGEPLGDEHLMALELVEGAPGPTAVAIYAPRGSFRVVPSANGSPEAQSQRRCSANQSAVVNALLHEQLRNRDDHDRALLAFASVDSGSVQCP
jgi:hypothetical protein